jgi:N-acetylmuramic acid 6-phosphate etherase
MKSGTAQKMVLNMISTTLMIRLGRVQGNRMVNMQLTNDKLIDRGTRMLQDSLGLSYDEARHRLLSVGNVSQCLEGITQPASKPRLASGACSRKQNGAD